MLKSRLANDATCTFCSNLDSIEHTFLDCPETKSFYYEALLWFNRVNDTNINLSNEQITFNEKPDNNTVNTRYSGHLRGDVLCPE